MTPLEEFDQWLKSYDDNYLNDFGVLFNQTTEFVFVDSPWPQFDSVEIISIIILCADGEELFALLNIETAEELEKTRPENLLGLFYAGKAMVLCSTAEGDSLQFQKAGDTMLAFIDGMNCGHEVKEQLIMPTDFVSYTNSYFHFRKELNNKQRNN